MDKSTVLDIVGNPTRISRQHSQDRWTYEVTKSDESGVDITYIFFADGRVTYVGTSGALNSTEQKTSKTKFRSIDSEK